MQGCCWSHIAVDVQSRLVKAEEDRADIDHYLDSVHNFVPGTLGNCFVSMRLAGTGQHRQQSAYFE